MYLSMGNEWNEMKLRACLDYQDFGSYHSVFIIEFPKCVGPTKFFPFGLVFNTCFHHSKLKNLS